MAEEGPPPVKRMRYNLRSSSGPVKIVAKSKSKSKPTPPRCQTRYLLRSSPKTNDVDLEFVELDTLKRKQKSKDLTILNDHCLFEIFEYLKPNDLCKMAEVNQRLCDALKSYFRVKYNLSTSFDLTPLASFGHVNLQAAQTFLRIFGNEIYALKLSRYFFDHIPYRFEQTNYLERLLPVVWKHCKSVKELTLLGFYIPNSIVKSVFGFDRVETLILDHCRISCDWRIMKKLKNLSLSFVDSGGQRKMFQQLPDKLETLHLLQVTINNKYMMELLNANRNLKSLSVVKPEENSTKFFPALRNLEDLEEFEFQKLNQSASFNNDLNHLLSLKKLKVLKFACKSQNMPMSALELLNGLATNGIALEHLELGVGHFDDEAAGAISKLTTIKVLKLNEMDGFTESHILSIAKKLELLEELVIKTHSNISQDGITEIVREAKRLACLKIEALNLKLDLTTYQKILALVQERDEQIQLDFTIYGNGNLLVPKERLKGSDKQWLAVKELNRNANSIFDTLIPIPKPKPYRRRRYSDYYSEYYSDSDNSDYYNEREWF